MPRFWMLASGSSGNAAFLQSDGFGLLIDAGIGPRLLSSRLAAIGKSMKDVSAVLLTHTHTDHWKDRTFAQLRTNHVPLYCHQGHFDFLAFSSPAFESLRKANLVRGFMGNEPFEFPTALRCLPVPIPHDSDPTFAFRIEGSADLFGDTWSLGYAADLGAAPSALIDAFRDVNVLALEFNHDEEMERRSGRPWSLIARVLGDEGHLSNRQAATTLRDLLFASTSGQLKHVVQLHLSRHCNRPRLAQAAAKQVLDKIGYPITLHTARQDVPTRAIELKS